MTRWNQKERSNIQQKPRVSKEVKAVLPPDFQTDESMKDMDYDEMRSNKSISDISGYSGYSEYLDRKRRITILKRNYVSPLMYYQ